jgi:hypothetical protein
MLANKAGKHTEPQAAMKTHLSQSADMGAFEGQHGISPAIASIEPDADMSAAIACLEVCEDVSATTGRETGANARPAIIETASSRRRATLVFTTLGFHKIAAVELSEQKLHLCSARH